MTAIIGAQITNPVGASEYSSSGRAFGLGDRLVTQDGKEYVFARASGAITGAGYVVFFNTSWAAAQLSTANDARGNLVGVATSAVTDGDYAWFQVSGLCDAIQVLASAAANTRLNTTATAGALDDDGTAGAMQVQGIYLSSARAASQGNAAGILNNPFVDVTL